MTITVPSNVITDLQTAVSGGINSLWPVIVVIIAVPLTFYFLRKLIALFPKPRK